MIITTQRLAMTDDDMTFKNVKMEMTKFPGCTVSVRFWKDWATPVPQFAVTSPNGEEFKGTINKEFAWKKSTKNATRTITAEHHPNIKYRHKILMKRRLMKSTEVDSKGGSRVKRTRWTSVRDELKALQSKKANENSQGEHMSEFDMYGFVATIGLASQVQLLKVREQVQMLLTRLATRHIEKQKVPHGVADDDNAPSGSKATNAKTTKTLTATSDSD